MSWLSSHNRFALSLLLGMTGIFVVSCQREERKHDPPPLAAPPPSAPTSEPLASAVATSEQPEPAKQEHIPAPTGRLMAIEGNEQRTVRLDEVLPPLGPRVVESDDPYYQRMKRFWVVPATEFLSEIFGDTPENLRASKFIVQAKDGFVVHFSGEKLLDPAAFFAFADAEHEQFLPIGEQKAHPGPLYVVWEGERGDLSEYPRPWALVSIERTKQDAGLERTVPPEGFGDNQSAKRGDELFKKECIRCHCINQQGGKVGPDLNVPQNILAYRPEAQVRAYIRDPKTFRYSNMPPHPDLTDEDLDALVSYLKVMGKHQIDPHVDVTPENAHDHN